VARGNSGRRRGLTKKQKAFMRQLQSAIEAVDAPVSVSQIRIRTGRSDSHVRSCIKILISAGYLRCIGRTRQKRYVPSVLWLQELNDEPPCSWIGGICETEGCPNEADDYFAGRYLCRTCIIGLDAIGDRRDIRRRAQGLWGPQSTGAMWEERAPSFRGREVDD